MLGPFLEGGRGLAHINVVKCALCARQMFPEAARRSPLLRRAPCRSSRPGCTNFARKEDPPCPWALVSRPLSARAPYGSVYGGAQLFRESAQSVRYSFGGGGCRPDALDSPPQEHSPPLQ